ncbi:c-type cytochrome [Ramlibacter sp. XY19]|uniref:cytochrome-c peroxidase n=1 Tax=Ramlibacter paludis TaxID=2908000 RepID=UPI0023D9F93B|nr:cytochrome c peroxidase [Ramlibacter paludis]MCG2592677.1 c-type cytochrome [Ramlibacter paludis]
MSKLASVLATSTAALLVAAGLAACAGADSGERVPAAATADRAWLLPASIPQPAENPSTPARVALGKALFFDTRLSGPSGMSCASCHEPTLGWSDGRKTSAVGKDVMTRASPTVLNVGYNTQFTWDGRKKSLEDHAMGPHRHLSVADYKASAERLGALEGYQKMFAAAYPGEAITQESISKALAVFQRSLVSTDSNFDRWVAGDRTALTPAQYRGFKLFTDPAKANCAACHNGPNFTDNGFHNVGLKSGDVGRYAFRKLDAMKGAFKTPTLRDIENTAPYFHDGSAATLREVVEYYARGGEDASNRSPDVRKLDLTERDKEDLVAFLRALTGRHAAFVPPQLPQ